MKLAHWLASFVAAITIGTAGYGQEYPTMTLRYSSNIPEGVNTSRIDTFFSAEIERRSGGAIRIQHFWANTLGGEAEIVDLVGTGAVDLGLIVMGNQAARMPFAAVTNALPMTFTDGPRLNALTRDIFTNNATIQAEFAAARLRPLLYRYLPDYRVYCTRPMQTMADFQNARIRSYGAFVPAMFESLGAVPVNISPVEMIQAMQSGALDCTYMFNSAVMAFGVNQVADYGTTLSFGVISAHTLFVSQDTWDSWPEAVQTLFEEVAADAEAYGNELIATDEAAAVAAVEAAGMEIIEFTEPEAVAAAVPDMLELWVARMADLGKGDEAAALAEHIRANR